MVKSFMLASWLTLVAVLANSEAKHANYEIEVEDVEAVKDPNYLIQTKEFRVTKVDQSSFIINMTADLTEDLPTDLIVRMTMYERMPNNRYSDTPVRIFNGRLCDLVRNDRMVYPEMVFRSNLPREGCPFRKGAFWVQDYFPNMDILPENFPGGDRWRADIQYLDHSKVVFQGKVYMLINRHQ